MSNTQVTRYHIPETEIQAMLEQRRAGVSTFQIARDFHRDPVRVKKIMRGHDTQPKGFILTVKMAELFGVEITTLSYKAFRRKWGLNNITKMRWGVRGFVWDEAQVLERVRLKREAQLSPLRPVNTGRVSSPNLEQRIIRHFKRQGTATRLELDLSLYVSQRSLSAALESLDTQGLIVRSAHDCTVWKLSRKALL